MKGIFTQTREHRIENAMCTDDLKNLPDVIHQHTDFYYVYTPTKTGCFLKPTFRKMPYLNSFVPEIKVSVSCEGPHTVLHLRGRPTPSIRIFMILWFSILLLAEVFLLAAAGTSDLDSLVVVFIPLIMAVFGYLLCKIATKTTFHSVTEAIRKGLTQTI